MVFKLRRETFVAGTQEWSLYETMLTLCEETWDQYKILEWNSKW